MITDNTFVFVDFILSILSWLGYFLGMWFILRFIWNKLSKI